MNARPDDTGRTGAPAASVSGDTSSAPDGVSRRTFVEITGALASMLALGGAVSVFGPDAALLRPPGGGDEARFLSLCTKCDRCRSVCPTRVIAPCTLEDGLLAARTPRMDFKLGECTFCGKCTEVCPTGALAPYATGEITFEGDAYLSPDLVLGLAIVNESRCLAWVDASGCTICSQKCPYGAITLDGISRPVVDAGKCNGCGICEYICPSSQWRSYLGGSERGIEVKTLDEAEAEAR